MITKFFLTALLFTFFSGYVFAQSKFSDTVTFNNNVTLVKDSRIETLENKMTSYSVSIERKPVTISGYRLMVLSSTDRELVMKVRAYLLRTFPDQQVFMYFQSPYIKLKFGSFTSKAEAETYRKQIVAAQLFVGNVYLLPEKIQVSPDKVPVKQK
ncbi:MAG: SPOR domain-containing protein [Ferruginibacter sp.]|nr:SPOR domain-containing protein [Ferruginibacter sp.]